MTDQAAPSTGQPTAPSAPAAAPPEMNRQAAPEVNPRSRGISPARDHRERNQQPPANGQHQQSGAEAGQQQQAAQDKFTIDGTEWSHEQIRESIAHRIEADARKAALPSAPDKYEVRLPADFQAPEGVKFEFDTKDPALARARDLAHKRGVDQETFSDMLGVYAATKIGEHQRMGELIKANRERLGAAADNRIGQIETWLKARVGAKAAPMMASLRAYPVVETVEALEGIIRQFSNQGGADYSQSGRNNDQPSPGKITGYENMTFEQRRAAQDASSGRGPMHSPRASGGR